MSSYAQPKWEQILTKHKKSWVERVAKTQAALEAKAANGPKLFKKLQKKLMFILRHVMDSLGIDVDPSHINAVDPIRVRQYQLQVIAFADVKAGHRVAYPPSRAAYDALGPWCATYFEMRAKYVVPATEQ